MYKDIGTKCWSIKEVNKNLGDRQPLVDYSVNYLKKACSDLAVMLQDAGKKEPGEMIEVMDQSGKKRSFSLEEVAGMLSDVKKIVELNLIDHIDKWAKLKLREHKTN
jgi:hypothetical protein